MRDGFISDLFFSLGFIGKIVIAIMTKVNGLLGLGIVWVIVCCIAGLFIPMGYTICFAVLKLTGFLSLGWIWILVPLVLDCFCIDGLLKIYTGKR